MPQDEPEAPDPVKWILLREMVRLTAVLGLIGLVAYAVWRINEPRLDIPPGLVQLQPPPAPDAPHADCGPPAGDGRATIVEMLYSDEKRAWIEHAADVFARRCPNIQIRLTAMADFAAADAILTGAARPTVWAPTDEMIVSSLGARWSERSQEPLLTADEPTSLVRSPLVLLLWNDRLRVLTTIRERTAAQTGLWSQMMCAGIAHDPPVDTVALADRVPGTWSAWYAEVASTSERRAPAVAAPTKEKPTPRSRTTPPEPEPEPLPEPKVEPKVEYTAPFPSLADIASWGRVEIGHSSPTHSAAGLEALYLMAHDHLLAPADRDGDSTDEFTEGAVRSGAGNEAALRAAFDGGTDELRRWLARCEGGLESDPQSAPKLTDAMFHAGSVHYDGVATYEHLVFPVLDRLAGNDDVMENMTVVYPTPTIVNRHPAVLLARGADDSRAAARKWLAFLRSSEMQRVAIELGFRPADPAVKIREHRVDANPFLRHRRYGVAFAPTLAEPPRLDGARVNLLLETWRDATGRN